jgi:hypothetical protein
MQGSYGETVPSWQRSPKDDFLCRDDAPLAWLAQAANGWARPRESLRRLPVAARCRIDDIDTPMHQPIRLNGTRLRRAV